MMHDILEEASRFVGAKLRVAHEGSGGLINQSCVLEESDGRKYFLKYREAVPVRFYESEARSLELLRGKTQLLIPQVYGWSDREEGGFLLLEYFEPGNEDWKTLARELAALHHHSAPFFGGDADNYIGLTRQQNKWNSSWGKFFICSRLTPQIELGEEWIPEELQELFFASRELFSQMLSSDGLSPSLIHGDLWAGNVLFTRHGPALVDPAAYYGDAEAEIAFTELFGGFPSIFRSVYESIRPLRSDYGVRRELYNLYHLLNHANIFGGSYCRRAIQALRTLSSAG